MSIFLGSIVCKPIQKQIAEVSSHIIQSNQFREVNKRAIVTETVKGFEKGGRVHFQATWWPALCSQQDLKIEAGQRCRVVGRNNITLIVEPIAPMITSSCLTNAQPHTQHNI